MLFNGFVLINRQIIHFYHQKKKKCSPKIYLSFYREYSASTYLIWKQFYQMQNVKIENIKIIAPF